MAIARPLFRSPDLYFAELVCYPEDPEWGEENLISRPIVALPSTPVWQSHDGGPRTLMSPTHAVFHHPGSHYHRQRFLGKGYRCVFFFPSDALVREIAAEVDPEAAWSASFRFPVSAAPVDGPVFALGRRLAGELAAGRPGGLPAREGLYAVLRRVVLSSFRMPAARLGARGSTARGRKEIVEEAKEAISREPADRIRLDELAARLYVSPYHLARIFRATTGYSIHAYQTQLRLREGLDRLGRGSAGSVGQLGMELGFSNHSHFTSSFRRSLGIRPSELSTFSTA